MKVKDRSPYKYSLGVKVWHSGTSEVIIDRKIGTKDDDGRITSSKPLYKITNYSNWVQEYYLMRQ
jgi:hypothetical protein